MGSSSTRVMHWRAEQVGLLTAGSELPLTFQRTLMSRSVSDQAIITGLNTAIVSALVGAIQQSIQSLALALVGGAGDREADDRYWSRVTAGFDLAAIGAGVAVQRLFQHRDRERYPRAGARSAGYGLAEAGVAGAVIAGFDEMLSLGGRRRPLVPVAVPATVVVGGLRELRRRRRESADAGAGFPPVDMPVPKALATSAGVMVGSVGFSVGRRALAKTIGRRAARVLPGNEHFWRPVGDLITIGGLFLGGRAAMQFVYRKIEGTAAATEPAFDLAPIFENVSGADGSLVPYSTMSTQGRRFVWTARTADGIFDVMGEKGHDAVRVFVGLDSAPSEEERVELALAELERLGAFDRSWILVVSPTGTGYVNYAAVGSFEYVTRGDCATVAMQYSLRPSALSLDKVAQGRQHMRRLLIGIQERLQSRPVERRPRVMLFGESLGAWTSQDSFLHEGTVGLRDRDIECAIWIGTPHESEWKKQVFGDPRPDVDRSLVGEFNDIGEYEALTKAERDALRYVLITHGNDGVACLGPEIAVQAPSWLGDPELRPKRVPKGMRWEPLTTFLQVLIDMKNSMQVVPGVFAANGHDYRADLPGFFSVVVGIPTTDDQVEAITAALEADERRRARWISEAKETGGMAEVVARRVLAAEPELVKAALYARRDELDAEPNK